MAVNPALRQSASGAIPFDALEPQLLPETLHSPLFRESVRESGRNAFGFSFADEASMFLAEEERRLHRHCLPTGHRSTGQLVHIVASGEGLSIASRSVFYASALTTSVAIVLSCYTDKDVADDTSSWEYYVERLCVVFFTIEYGLRLATARHSETASSDHNPQCDHAMEASAEENPKKSTGNIKFFLKPMNLIDFLAVAPYWLGMLLRSFAPIIDRLEGIDDNGASASPVLRVVKLLRFIKVIRVLKLNRYSHHGDIVAKSLVHSSDQLVTLFFLLAIATVLFGTIIYHIQNETSSVPDTFFFVAEELAGITAIDQENRMQSIVDSTAGRIMGLFLMASGMLFHGLIMASLMAGFNEVLKKHLTQRNAQARLKRIYKKAQDPDGLAQCKNLYLGLKRHDPALAIALEPYVSANVGPVTMSFFNKLVRDASTRLGIRDANQDTSLASLGTSIALVKEHQCMMQIEMQQTQFAMRQQLADQSRMLEQIMTQLKIQSMSKPLAADATPPNQNEHCYFFICCGKAHGDGTRNLLRANLVRLGFRVEMWCDREEADEEAAVCNAGALILLLTKGMLRTPLYQKQLRWARQHSLAVVGVYEADIRRDATIDLQEECARAPTDLQPLVKNLDFLAFQRYGADADAMYVEIVDRGTATKNKLFSL